MGLRTQFSELDPRYTAPQQEYLTQNPYALQRLQQEQQASQSQLALMRQLGEAQAQKAQAETMKSGSWTRGLDAFTRAAPEALKQGFDIQQQRAKFAQDAETANVNRAYTMENTLGARQRREFDARFEPETRALGNQQTRANIGQTEAGTRATEAQRAQTEVNTEKNRIELDNAKIEQDYLNSDASALGFENAKPGETVRNFGLRMKSIGDNATVQQILENVEKLKMENKLAPARFELEKRQANSQINLNNAQAGNVTANTLIAKEQHAIKQFEDKSRLAEQKVNDFMNYLKGENFSKERQLAETINFIKNMNEQFGLPADQQALMAGLGKAIATRNAADQAAIMAAFSQAQVNPVMKDKLNNAVRANRIAIAGTELVKQLNAEITKYSKGAGELADSDEAKLSAQRIKVILKKAAAEDPIFQPYVDQFEKIATGIYTVDPDTMKNALFGPTIKNQMKGMSKNIINMIKTSINVNKNSIPPSLQSLVDVELGASQFNDASNFFSQTVENLPGGGGFFEDQEQITPAAAQPQPQPQPQPQFYPRPQARPQPVKYRREMDVSTGGRR